ncbi:hypothetical protein BJ508DRAFT_418068 [Ascobolus immersus RN42]|uniref:Uncharacterized protein n=1 Tax=Ascobolus immersus RN42 TaxID=1160509 RepID=A0A3N4HNS3_ASCIM|nr:hypothetical protein BJ508DRAFT_418068 [Ascobolus immersus RN42]
MKFTTIASLFLAASAASVMAQSPIIIKLPQDAEGAAAIGWNCSNNGPAYETQTFQLCNWMCQRATPTTGAGCFADCYNARGCIYE